MVIKLQLRAVMFMICVILLGLAGSLRADETPVVTGEHWTKSSEQVKKVYLIGIVNLLQVKGVEGQTIDSVQRTLDKWYAAHPDQLSRPVLDTIWFEIVVPGLRKSK
jgi:hypothetical protein